MLTVLATSFTAGLVATINPCGFAMLPAYLGYFLGGDQEEGGMTALRRALTIGGVVSAGFLLVFGVTGALLVIGLRSLAAVIPWLALLVGIGLMVLGVFFLRGRYLNLRLPTLGRISRERNSRSVFLFGVSYAIASLSCTLGIFLSLVATTFTQTSFLGGLAAFLAYGVGMSMVLLVITITMAFGQDAVVRRIRGAARYVDKLSGVVLIGAGGFIVWYWATVLSSGADVLGGASSVRFVDRVSAALTEFIGGNPLLVVAAALVIVAAILLYLGLGRGRGSTGAIEEKVSSER